MTTTDTNFEKKMTSNIVATAGEAPKLTAIEANPTQDSTVTYDFVVNVTSGSLSGQQFTGFFSYNRSTITGIGSEEVGVSEGLSVRFEFLGMTYTEANDFDAPLYPRVLFENGKLAGIDLEAFDNGVSYQIIRDFDNKNSVFTYRLEGESSKRMGSGSVSYSLREDSHKIDPEASMLLGQAATTAEAGSWVNW